jgi:hypothetical protein
MRSMTPAGPMCNGALPTDTHMMDVRQTVPLIPSDTTVQTRPADFFELAQAAFRQAEQSTEGPIDHYYAIGGYGVRLRFAGSGLVAKLRPALEHLKTQPNPAPALTICVWDSASTGTTMPPPPWSPDDNVARGEVRGFNDGHIQTAFNPGSGTLSMLDARLDLAIYWIRDASRFPYYESGAPLLTILHWWMGRHGRQLAHAGAVGTPTGGVLLAGKGGSGKSTTALACLFSELAYVGDDYCLLVTDPSPYAYSLYNSGKVDADHVGRFPDLVPLISNADSLDTEKPLVFLDRHYPGKLASGVPIRAILLPEVTGLAETSLVPASPAAAFQALAPSTVFQLSGAGHEAFQAMARFIKGMPCYRLKLGTNLPQIPDVILDLLSQE